MARYFNLAILCLATMAFLGVQANNNENAQLQEIIERHLKHIDTNRQTLSLLKELIQGMDNEMQQVRKRTCYFNAGMSHSCDYKEVIGAVDEANYWSSEMSPGRRKRFSSPYYSYPSRPTSAIFWPHQTQFLKPAHSASIPRDAEIKEEPTAKVSQPTWKPDLQDAFNVVSAERALESSEESPEQTL